MDNLSKNKVITVAIKKTDTLATNIMSAASINCHNKKVINCYILHTVSLVIILVLIITIICYHYAKHEGIVQNGKSWVSKNSC